MAAVISSSTAARKMIRHIVEVLESLVTEPDVVQTDALSS